MVRENQSNVKVTFDVAGRLQSDEVRDPSGKEFSGELTLGLKPAVADGLKFGDKLHFDLVDE